MPENIIIYGDIVNAEARKAIQAAHAGSAQKLTWCSDPSLPAEGRIPAIVFVDLDNSEFSSPEFLVSVAQAREDVSILGKSSNPSVDEAVRFAKLGVGEILTPGQCFDRITTCLASKEEEPESKTVTDQRYGFEALIGVSPHIARVKSMLRTLSEVDFPSALILGETGTGKSLVCKVLHNTGLRSPHSLVEVNCSAIPDELFESELFGHVKGAFTDAKTDKMGLFEFAQNGTLFLDEVGNLTLTAQAKLLKVLEDRSLRKVGALAETDVNVRVVAATNIDMARAIAERRFRDDLLHRLNLLVLEVPCLRDRPEDIPLLVEHYVRYYSCLYHKPDQEVDDAAISELMQYEWPGNVRELCNVIERMVLLTRSTRIKASTIKSALKRGRIGIADRRQIRIDVPAQGLPLQSIEETVVSQVLDMCGWNKSEAARFLGISRPRLRRIMDTAKLEQDRRSA